MLWDEDAVGWEWCRIMMLWDEDAVGWRRCEMMMLHWLVWQEWGGVQLAQQGVLRAAPTPADAVLVIDGGVLVAVLHHKVDWRSHRQVGRQVGEVVQHVRVLPQRAPSQTMLPINQTAIPIMQTCLLLIKLHSSLNKHSPLKKKCFQLIKPHSH